MRNKVKYFVKKILRKDYGWFGNFKTWKAAKDNCKGYNAASILEKVKEAALKVKKGEAAYERDSVVFDEVQYSYPLLKALQSISSENDNSLTIVDFGGSLGSSYFQNKILYDKLKEVRWTVVEQENFAEAGQQLIADDHLSFFSTIEEALEKKGHHDILLLSCVLPYLEDPFTFLKKIKAFHFKYIIIENTYFNDKPGNRLTIQKVRPEIYEASYPAWFLNYQDVISIFSDQYTILSEYYNDASLFLDGKKIQYRGIILKII